MKRWNKGFSYILIVCLILCTLGEHQNLLAADNKVISIHSVEQLVDLSKKCSLDTWSRGKVVNLMCDLDVSNQAFVEIPIFSGTFNGNGHIISGVNIKAKGATHGLFRYIEKGAVVKNLTVKGNITTTGTKKILGGIAGQNAGIIKECYFRGTVKGESYIGGIVGINEVTGKVMNSVAVGSITGIHYVGGVVGENLGTILDSKNKMLVNSTVSEVDISLETNFEPDIKKGKLNTTEHMTTNTDIGGIAGFSTGIIQGCYNYETIGYPHIGYNVGGIVGRQSGYVNDCINNGYILGRKDVGGIAGQVEPYITLKFSEGKLSHLQSELSKLQRLINDTTESAGHYSDEVAMQLENTKNSVDQAVDSTDALLKDGKTLYNETIDTVNDVSARVSTTLKALEPIMEEAMQLGEKMSTEVSELRETLDAVEATSEEGKKVLEEIRDTIDTIEENGKDYRKAIRELDRAIKEVNIALGEGEGIKQSLDEVGNALLDLANSIEAIEKSFERFESALKEVKEWRPNGHNIIELIESIKKVKEAIGMIGDTTYELGKALQNLTKTVGKTLKEVDLEPIIYVSNKVEQSMEQFLEATAHTQKVLESMQEVVDAGGDTLIAADEVVKKLKKAADTLYGISQDGVHIIGGIKGIVVSLAEKPTIELPKINSKTMQKVDHLNQSLGDVSNSLGGLKDIAAKNNKIILSNLQAINDQFYHVLTLLIEATTETGEQSGNLENHHEDISDEDTESNTQGKVVRCSNEGKIQGDVNVGGVTGAMAIEYDFDPEDDVTKVGNKSMKFQYLTRAVVKECTNKGVIASKKNNVGSIVGLMDIGSVTKCYGYGRIESTDGDYIGGIVGNSNSHIQDSFAMCVLSGGKNIGGIAGYGTKLTNNYAMIQVEEHAESVGAIAGNVENIETQNHNYFVDRGIQGIDSISYDGKAAPISYEAFEKLPHLPKAFTSLAITFMADGEEVEKIPFKFGESINEDKLPPIPEKRGYYSKWPDFDFTTLTFSATLEAIYIPYTTVIESTTRKGNKPLALIEGGFLEDAVLSVTEAKVAPPKEASKEAEVWEVSFNSGAKDTKVESYELRLLVEDKKALYKLDQNNKWQKIRAKHSGSYDIVTLVGTQGIFCIDREENTLKYILIGSIVVIFGIFLIRAKKKHSKQKNK